MEELLKKLIFDGLKLRNFQKIQRGTNSTKKNSKNLHEFLLNNFNLYNSPSWFFQVESRDLIIFPSDTQHFVENKKGNNVRTSLSFNVFVKN